MDLVAVGALLSPVFSALVAFFVARRKASGHVDTSEAAELWDASSQFRTDLAAEISALRGEVMLCRAEVREKDVELRELRQRVWELERENARLQGTLP